MSVTGRMMTPTSRQPWLKMNTKGAIQASSWLFLRLLATFSAQRPKASAPPQALSIYMKPPMSAMMISIPAFQLSATEGTRYPVKLPIRPSMGLKW